MIDTDPPRNVGKQAEAQAPDPVSIDCNKKDRGSLLCLFLTLHYIILYTWLSLARFFCVNSCSAKP